MYVEKNPNILAFKFEYFPIIFISIHVLEMRRTWQNNAC